jgi:hypothetical protein
VPFGVGERLNYEVRFGPIKVGSGSMEVIGLESIRGRQTYHTQFRVKGGTFFYKVNDVMSSWIDSQTLASLRYVQDFEEGGRDREKKYEIYPERRVYQEEGRPEQPSVSEPLDDGSFLYFVRTIPLEVGKTYVFDRYFKPDRNPVVLTGVRRDTVTVAAGTFATTVVRPSVRARGIFAEDGQAEVWFSDDAARYPVQVKTRFAKFSVVLTLQGIERGADASALPGLVASAATAP